MVAAEDFFASNFWLRRFSSFLLVGISAWGDRANGCWRGSGVAKSVTLVKTVAKPYQTSIRARSKVAVASRAEVYPSRSQSWDFQVMGVSISRLVN